MEPKQHNIHQQQPQPQNLRRDLFIFAVLIVLSIAAIIVMVEFDDVLRIFFMQQQQQSKSDNNNNNHLDSVIASLSLSSRNNNNKHKNDNDGTNNNNNNHHQDNNHNDGDGKRKKKYLLNPNFGNSHEDIVREHILHLDLFEQRKMLKDFEKRKKEWNEELERVVEKNNKKKHDNKNKNQNDKHPTTPTLFPTPSPPTMSQQENDFVNYEDDDFVEFHPTHPPFRTEWVSHDNPGANAAVDKRYANWDRAHPVPTLKKCSKIRLFYEKKKLQTDIEEEKVRKERKVLLHKIHAEAGKEEDAAVYLERAQEGMNILTNEAEENDSNKKDSNKKNEETEEETTITTTAPPKTTTSSPSANSDESEKEKQEEKDEEGNPNNNNHHKKQKDNKKPQNDENGGDDGEENDHHHHHHDHDNDHGKTKPPTTTEEPEEEDPDEYNKNPFILNDTVLEPVFFSNPRPKIAILTMHSVQVTSDSSSSRVQVQRASLIPLMWYCKKNRYDLIVEDHDIVDVRRAPAWSKVRALRKWLPQYEWVIWMDMDVIITNHAQTLESFIQHRENVILQENEKKLKSEHDHWTRLKHSGGKQAKSLGDKFIPPRPRPLPHIIIGNDWNGINSGITMWRNSTFTQSFVKRMWGVPKALAQPFWDQGAMKYLLTRNFRGRDERAADYDFSHLDITDEVNRYPMGLLMWGRNHDQIKWKEGNLLVHFASCKFFKTCIKWMNFFSRYVSCAWGAPLWGRNVTMQKPFYRTDIKSAVAPPLDDPLEPYPTQLRQFAYHTPKRFLFREETEHEHDRKNNKHADDESEEDNGDHVLKKKGEDNNKNKKPHAL